MICCLFNETPAPFNSQYHNNKNITILKKKRLSFTTSQSNPQYHDNKKSQYQKYKTHFHNITNYPKISQPNPQYHNNKNITVLKISNTFSRYQKLSHNVTIKKISQN